MPHARASDADPADLANRLHSLAIHLLRRVRREDVHSGVGPARLSALSVIGFSGPLTVGALAAAEGVSVPTISRIISALQADGLVERHGDTRDARVVRLAATEEGMRVLREGRARRTAQVGKILDELAVGELAALQRALEALERVLGEPASHLPS